MAFMFKAYFSTSRGAYSGILRCNTLTGALRYVCVFPVVRADVFPEDCSDFVAGAAQSATCKVKTVRSPQAPLLSFRGVRDRSARAVLAVKPRCMLT